MTQTEKQKLRGFAVEFAHSMTDKCTYPHTNPIYNLAIQMIAAQDEIERLRGALTTAANHIEGVSLALSKHGTNINILWFIAEYERNARIARAALKEGER